MEIKILSSLEKVFPDIEPKLVINQASMLANERFNFQICIINDEWLQTCVKIKATGDIAKYISFRSVDLAPSQLANYTNCDDYYIFSENRSRLYPDILRPFEYGDIISAGRQNKSIWATVHCPEGLPAGDHKLKFTVTLADGRKLTAKLTLSVIGAMLPESDLIYTNWMHYDGIAQYYKVKPWSNKFYKLFATFLDSAVQHGMNVLYTPIFTPALDTKVGWERMDVQLVKVIKEENGYKFDLSELDRFVDFALDHGVKYFEMSHLFTQWGATACPKIMAHTDKGYKRIFGWDTPSLGDEYKLFLSQFLPTLDNYLKEKGIAPVTFFHISDEPSEEQFEHFSKVAAFIRPFIKDYKVMDATSTPSNEHVDIPVLSTTHIPEDAPDNVWAYYCCSATTEYLSNRFFNMPSQRTRILGMQLYERNVNGFLQWAFNFYNTVFSLHPIDPFAVTDAGGGFPSGDSFMAYPGIKGAWDSIRLEVFNDGIQDRMALKLLEKYLGREEVLKLLHDEGVTGWKTYPRSAEWHTQFRDKINRLIEKNL